ncbi:uncharacterized protein K452DRAFT_52426 [Aplosporella prunicola CBS 121167]|uniref:Uncharacterized protein n=1 Tax=Aplosporella prunicola CBS 121167 TaxID=1176127 RepID=A0A6A6BB94_9PEZI|nr:uncharacterized protein K452DRAFT_52426 [Aplosporella prunicola CBS 121167]KAF2140187.1 hypothetical protein K452DRAFT_52426 [Aplosporella prunicola CBS 121167]
MSHGHGHARCAVSALPSPPRCLTRDGTGLRGTAWRARGAAGGGAGREGSGGRGRTDRVGGLCGRTQQPTWLGFARLARYGRMRGLDVCVYADWSRRPPLAQLHK